MTATTTPHFTSQRLRDQTANCDLRLAARCCMSVVNGMEKYTGSGTRLMGLAAAFLLAAEAAGLPPSDLMAYARNCINTAEGKRPEFAAASDYITQEVITHG